GSTGWQGRERRLGLSLRGAVPFLGIIDQGARRVPAGRLPAAQSVPVDGKGVRTVPGLRGARRRAGEPRRRLDPAMDDDGGVREVAGRVLLIPSCIDLGIELLKVFLLSAKLNEHVARIQSYLS